MKKWGWAAALGCLLLAGGLLLCLPSRERQASGGPPGLLIWIELDTKRLLVYENSREIARFAIAAGARDTPSPVGVFRVNRKFETALSGFGTRFLGLNVPWGDYGIHGTNQPASIGRNASHGCIRLSVRDAEALYRMIPLGTRVVVDGGAYGCFYQGQRALGEGDRGADVALLQRRLMLGGYLQGNADGALGTATRKAVIAARRALGLPLSDQADAQLQKKLGILLFD